MNIYIKTVLEFYDLFIRCIQFLMYISLFMFNNQIVYIKCFSENDEIFYLIPFLQLCIIPTLIPSITVYNPYEILDLCYVSYIKNSEIEQLACSEKTPYAIQTKINHLGHNENYERRHAIAKKYIFVEVNQHNVTDNYKRIGWSLIDEEITVGEYKEILQLPEDDATLDLTDADNLDIHELKNHEVLV